MDFFSSTAIKNLLARYETRPSKGLGQNFLIDQRILEKIIASADIKSTDIVLEVGPGIGILTQELAKKAKQVIAVEKDETMVKILKETLKDFENVEVIHGDILRLNSTNYSLPLTNYKVVANIPYYITGPLIRFLLENKNPPEEIILMLQKEVAQRICSNPPNMSLLAVSVQFYADPKIVSYVSKNCFWPSPRVDSAIIKIVPQKKYDIPSDTFFKVVKAGFSQPRKQLVNNLITFRSSNGVKLTKKQVSKWLSKNDVEPNKRAEVLNISDWINLVKNF